MSVPASCTCGSNRLTVIGSPSAVYRCHCTDCRKLLPKGEQYLHCAAFAAEQASPSPSPDMTRTTWPPQRTRASLLPSYMASSAMRCATMQVTAVQESTVGRPAKNPALVRTYCTSCNDHISNDKLGDDGKPKRRVSGVTMHAMRCLARAASAIKQLQQPCTTGDTPSPIVNARPVVFKVP